MYIVIVQDYVSFFIWYILQIRSYYGISRNLLIKFKDDTIDETSTLAQVLSSGSAISSMLDMSIRSLPGDHALPLQQVHPKPQNSVKWKLITSSVWLINLLADSCLANLLFHSAFFLRLKQCSTFLFPTFRLCQMFPQEWQMLLTGAGSYWQIWLQEHHGKVLQRKSAIHLVM